MPAIKPAMRRCPAEEYWSDGTPEDLTAKMNNPTYMRGSAGADKN